MIMMNKTWRLGAVATILLFGLTAHSGPIIVGNGGGSAEFYTYLGLRSFKEIVNLCLAQEGCHSRVSSQLSIMKNSVLVSSTELKTVTSQELGDQLFRKGEGTTYQVNQDLMFTMDQGQRRPWNYPEAVGFLVELWQSDFGFTSEECQQLQSSLMNLTASTIERVPLQHSDFRQYALVRVISPSSALIFEDSTLGSEAATFEFPFSQLSCANSSQANGFLRDVTIINARWGTVQKHDDHFQLLVNGSMNYSCATNSGAMARFRSHYQIFLSGNVISGHPVLDKNEVQIFQSHIER